MEDYLLISKKLQIWIKLIVLERYLKKVQCVICYGLIHKTSKDGLYRLEVLAIFLEEIQFNNFAIIMVLLW